MKKYSLLILVIVVIISAFPAVSFASDDVAVKRYEKGMESFKTGNYDIAFSYFVISGEERGYAPAQNMLGICYRDGLGTKRDLQEAERYFRLAADQGNSEAAANLSSIDREKEEKYQNAIGLYLDGKYAEAKSIFEELNGYKHSADFLDAMVPTPTPTPVFTPKPTPKPTPVLTPLPSPSPTPVPFLIPQNPSSLYGKALKENLINGKYYTDAQKTNIVTETFQYRKNSEGQHRAWYYGTYRDDIYPGYRVELYYADGLLFFANVTKNSKNQVTLHYWGNQIVACRDLRGYNTDVSYAGSAVYEAVNAEFGNLFSIALQYAP